MARSTIAQPIPLPPSPLNPVFDRIIFNDGYTLEPGTIQAPEPGLYHFTFYISITRGGANIGDLFRFQHRYTTSIAVGQGHARDEFIEMFPTNVATTEFLGCASAILPLPNLDPSQPWDRQVVFDLLWIHRQVAGTPALAAGSSVLAVRLA